MNIFPIQFCRGKRWRPLWISVCLNLTFASDGKCTFSSYFYMRIVFLLARTRLVTPSLNEKDRDEDVVESWAPKSIFWPHEHLVATQSDWPATRLHSVIGSQTLLQWVYASPIRIWTFQHMGMIRTSFPKFVKVQLHGLWVDHILKFLTTLANSCVLAEGHRWNTLLCRAVTSILSSERLLHKMTNSRQFWYSSS